jgi:uncharacterized membrane protein
MLTLEDFGTIFLLASFVGALIIASPALALVLPPLGRERFTELYLLGPNHMAEDYPFNVKSDVGYRVYLGISNHLGSSAYYMVYVKLRNQTEPMPNSTSSTPSPLQAIYEFRVFLKDDGVWEIPVDFAFKNLVFHTNSCIIKTLNVNGLDLQAYKVAVWDFQNKGYYLQLFFELWIYNFDVKAFSFHNRFVGIWLNMTE